MKIGLFNCWRGRPEHVVMADMMMRSCRKVMPDVPIIQLTDQSTPALYGVDEVRRRSHAHTAMLRVEHYIACEGEWVFLDTDILLQRDIRAVFDEPFDVAIADRVGCVTPTEGDDYPLYQSMPYNSGVVFSRSPDFWRAVLHHMETVPPEKKSWMGDQYGVNAVIQQGRFTVKVLPGRQYNCPPVHRRDACAEAAILHFKGPQRKEWLLARFQEVA